MGTLTLKTIMKSFSMAENAFPKHMQRRIYSLPDRLTARPSLKCKVRELDYVNFFDFWVPESFVRCFGKPGTELTYDRVCHIIAGRKKVVAETLQVEFVECPVQMFWDLKDHLKKALETHIEIYICIKNKGISVFDGENLDVTINDLSEEIKTKKELSESTKQDFAKRILNSIMESPECLSDERINKSKFHEILFDKNRDEIERLTVLSILGLFACATIENEEYYFNSIFKKLYDLDTRELVSRPETEIKPIKISRIDIWKAGFFWYENSMREGSRFAKIFPDTSSLHLPIYLSLEDKTEQPLMDMIEKTSDHLYLIGEGGIGKTTALYSIMASAYGSDNEQSIRKVPLFIELSNAYDSDDFDLTRGISKFILHTVQKQLHKALGTNLNLENHIEDIFMKKTTEPEYVLLLDGLNEVSCEKINGHVIFRMVVAEIIKMLDQYQNVRIILTSRSKGNFGNRTTSFRLLGINSKQIEEYLEYKSFSQSRIKKTKQNAQLMEILRIPLFLIMYAELDEDDEILSRGEILHAFFTKTNKERYSEKNRINTINADLVNTTGVDRSEESKECITPHMLYLIFDFIMPQIAWSMVKSNEIQIKCKDINAVIKRVLSDKTDTSFCGEYGIELFNEYLTDENVNVRTTVDRIRRVFGKNDPDNWDCIIAAVRTCLTKQFGLLISDDYKEYKVFHQHVRDYFAALYHINKMKLAAYISGDNKELAIECLSELDEEPLMGDVLVLVGEALGEMHNAPKYDKKIRKWKIEKTDFGSERELINRCLDIFRGYTNDKYAVWNLFQIIKLVRKDLSGADFNGLDLRKCRINGYRLGNGTFAANLNNAILTDEFFMPSGHTASVWSAQYSPDGNFIVTASSDKTAKVWDAKTYTEVIGGTLKGHECAVVSASYSPDGKYIVTGSSDGTAKVWDAKNYTVVLGGTLKGHKGKVVSAQYSPNGKYILTASDDRTFKVWDANSFVEVSNVMLGGHVSTVTYSPDGNHILSVLEDGIVKIWETKKYAVVYEGKIKTSSLGLYATSAVYNPEKNNIAIGSLDGTVNEWNVEGFEEESIRAFEGKTGISCSVQYSPDGKYIVTTSDSKVAKVFDVSSYQEVPGGVLEGHANRVCSASYSPDGKYIVTSSWDRTAKVWDTKTYNELPGGTLEGHINRVVSAQYSPDGTQIVTMLYEGTAYVWDSQTYNVVPDGVLRGDGKRAFSVLYSPDGKYIFAIYIDGTIKVWGAGDFKEISADNLVFPCGNVDFSHFSKDKKCLILSYSSNARIKAWDIETLNEVPCEMLTERDRSYRPFNYNPDGNNVICIQYGEPVVEDTYSWLPIWKLKGHRKRVNSAQYSIDGTRIVTASSDHTAKIWDAELFKEVNGGALIGHEGPVYTAQYSPDGNNIVTASEDGTVRIWNAETSAETHKIELISGIDVGNVDLRSISDSSSVSEHTKKILGKYGAIIE